jgi:hypothetical protein
MDKTMRILGQLTRQFDEARINVGDTQLIMEMSKTAIAEAWTLIDDSRRAHEQLNRVIVMPNLTAGTPDA